jgi:hypothetical protein
MIVETSTQRQLGREALAAMRAVAEAVELARAVEQSVATGALSKDDASPVTIATSACRRSLLRDWPAIVRPTRWWRKRTLRPYAACPTARMNLSPLLHDAVMKAIRTRRRRE